MQLMSATDDPNCRSNFSSSFFGFKLTREAADIPVSDFGLRESFFSNQTSTNDHSNVQKDLFTSIRSLKSPNKHLQKIKKLGANHITRGTYWLILDRPHSTVM